MTSLIESPRHIHCQPIYHSISSIQESTHFADIKVSGVDLCMYSRHKAQTVGWPHAMHQSGSLEPMLCRLKLDTGTSLHSLKPYSSDAKQKILGCRGFVSGSMCVLQCRTGRKIKLHWGEWRKCVC